MDFTGINIRRPEVEDLFTSALVGVENTGIHVDIEESKPTTGGYIGIAIFHAYERKVLIQIEVSLRNGKGLKGVRALIERVTTENVRGAYAVIKF